MLKHKINSLNTSFILLSACKKTQCQIRKRQVRGLRSQKSGVRQLADEHFSDKRKEEIGVFLLTLLIFSLFGECLHAQNLEDIGKQKPVTLSGGITARAIFYNSSGISSQRKPFSYIITGSPTVSIYNSFTIPITFTFSEQERSVRQPFNQFGMSPYYKWITVHAGYRNINYSQFTLAGHTFLGGGVDLTPGIFRFGFIYGRFNRATSVDTLSKALQPFTYTNWGYGVKMGLGKGGNFFDISVLKAKDDSTSVHPGPELKGTVTPAENLVVGINGQAKFLKHFTFSLEAATSLFTKNMSNTASLPDSAKNVETKLLGGFIHTNSTSEHYNAIQTGLGYQQKIFSLKFQYRRIDPNYKSMGAYFFNSDLENLTIAPSLNLLKNKLRLSGSIGLQHDNLNHQKQSTSKRTIGSANVSAEFTKHLGMDFSFSDYSNTQQVKTILLKDTFKIAQVSENFSLTPRYILATEKHVHALILSVNYNLFTSLDNSSNKQNDTKSKNYFLNYQITIVSKNLTLSTTLNYTDVKTASFEEGNYGITLGANYVLKNGKLTMGWNGSFLQGINSSSGGLILNQTVYSNYRISKHHSFGANINYINNKSQQTAYTPSFSEWKADVNYKYTF